MRKIRNPRCVCHRLREGMVLLNEENYDNIVLNNTAAFLYDHCEDGDEDEVISALISQLEPGVNPEQVKSDCTECFRQMVEAGVLLEAEA